ncbi:hypothetical protein SAMN05444959_11226 [Paracoccus seriniphilus]|uniref:Uncharacterized protein n=1 Tax=Paracoccus seriniphilus TaxID=184748 RepID=A0A239PZD0_9RHOB|nr:hypothetical protein SAMN05444959_11226 [Paracoccus seriniphilus]
MPIAVKFPGSAAQQAEGSVQGPSRLLRSSLSRSDQRAAALTPPVAIAVMVRSPS